MDVKTYELKADAAVRRLVMTGTCGLRKIWHEQRTRICGPETRGMRRLRARDVLMIATYNNGPGTSARSVGLVVSSD